MISKHISDNITPQMKILNTVIPFYFDNQLTEEKRAGCFTLNVFMLSCECLCFVSLPDHSLPWLGLFFFFILSEILHPSQQL